MVVRKSTGPNRSPKGAPKGRPSKKAKPKTHLRLTIPRDVRVIDGSLCHDDQPAQGQVFPEWAEGMREDSVGESPRKSK